MRIDGTNTMMYRFFSVSEAVSKTAGEQAAIISEQQKANAASAASDHDSVEISSKAYALQSTGELQPADTQQSADRQDSVKADTEGIYIERKDADTNRMTIRFENTAYVYRAIENGSITIDGKELILTDDLKKLLSKVAEEVDKNAEAAFNQEMLAQNMEAAKQSAEAAGEAFGELIKMLEIARRISKGGHVPALDEKKLMEFSFEMYLTAKTAALTAKEHEEYDSLFKDEDESGSAGEQQTDPLTQAQTYSVEMDVSVGETVVVENVSAVVGE